MVYHYKSNFAERIQEFIRQKRALGYSYADKEKTMNNFDVFCREKFPNETVLTKELCYAWVYDSKYKVGDRGRLSPIRELAKYLISIGENAYIIPTELKIENPRRLPHIYCFRHGFSLAEGNREADAWFKTTGFQPQCLQTALAGQTHQL